MQVHTLPPRGGRVRGRGAAGAAQSCGCKPNGDARCCASASCGCTRAGLGCSVACHCRGFARVCANANAPLPQPACKAEADASRDAKRPKPQQAGPFAGAPRRLADVDPEERAAAAGDRDGFLRALEAQRAAAAAPVAPPPAPLPAPVAPLARAAAAEDADVIDLCDSDEDAAPAAPPKAAPPPAGASKTAVAPAAAQPRPAPKPPAPRLPLAPAASSYDPINPPQYVPAGGFKSGGELRVRETVRLRDVDGAWLPGLNACLDTGNEARARRATHCSQEGPPVFAALRASDALIRNALQGCTLISFAAARRALLVDASGVPTASFGRVGHIEVRGVVAGATDRVPTMRIECACPQPAARLL